MPKSIAIDGTAGSGKGTISKILADRLGFYHLDTGAIYRTIAYDAISKNVDIYNEQAVVDILGDCDVYIKLEKGKQINMLAGEDLGQKIRTPQIDVAASVVSVYHDVRVFATRIQHALAKKHDVIIEGRDIGTVVLPNADYKFFVTAKPEIRAERRLKQHNLPESEYSRILQEIIERDERDMTRAVSPLKQAPDAVLIDTSYQTIEESMNEILSHIK